MVTTSHLATAVPFYKLFSIFLALIFSISSGEGSQSRQPQQRILPEVTTKIVGFTSYEFIPIALKWYDQLTALGYDNHFIIATDSSSQIFLESLPAIRYETEIREEDHRTLFAARIKYILKQLKMGYNILLSDVDNIFSRYIPTSVFEAEPFDVIHSYETKHPPDVYEKQGFVVCGCLAFFRADAETLDYLGRVAELCSYKCDDQVSLNRILANEMNMVWNKTAYSPEVLETHRPLDPIFRSDGPNIRFNGTDSNLGMVGVSNVTGLRVKIWDRNFSFRGPMNANPCPKNNWVAMPFIWVKSRKEGPQAKFNQIDDWIQHCEEEVIPVK